MSEKSSAFGAIREFWRLLPFLDGYPLRKRGLVFAGVLATIASLLEAVVVTSLIPMLSGLLQADFSAIREHGMLRRLLVYFPGVSGWGNATLFLVWVAFFLTCGALKSWFQYLSGLIVTTAIRSFAHSVRQALFDRYLALGKLYFDRRNSGQLMHFIGPSTESVSAELNQLFQVLQAGLTALAYLVILFALSVKLTLMSFTLLPILHFSFRRMIRLVEGNSLALQAAMMELYLTASNYLYCIPLVKAYNAEPFERARFQRTSEKVAGVQRVLDTRKLFLPIAQDYLTLITLVVLVAVAARMMVSNHSISAASLLVFFAVLRRTGTNFGMINNFRIGVASVHGQLRSLLDVFETPADYYVPEGQHDFVGLKSAIEFRNLTFTYPDGVRALQGVSFRAEANQTTAIVGASGSGKSTLINLLMRYYDCPAHGIFLDGRDIRDCTTESVRRHVAFISQDTFLLGASLHENLIYGLKREVPAAELARAIERARLQGLVDALPQGLQTQIGERGVKLSGGERQRVAIARAVLKGAELLLLDEATSALDSATEKLVLEALSDLSQNRTVIVIAHRLATIRSADKVVVLEHGHVVEQGSPSQLLSQQGRFHHYWKNQDLLNNAAIAS